eukprot:Opistho-2@80167
MTDFDRKRRHVQEWLANADGSAPEEAPEMDDGEIEGPRPPKVNPHRAGTTSQPSRRRRCPKCSARQPTQKAAVRNRRRWIPSASVRVLQGGLRGRQSVKSLCITHD